MPIDSYRRVNSDCNDRNKIIFYLSEFIRDLQPASSMSYHDIHQYYFEKYLRNEMTDEDRIAFEEKLSGDEEVRKAFEYYQRNRKKFIANLVKVSREREHLKLNSWIYLLISISGIILAVNFYLDNKELRSYRLKGEPSLPFYKKIPFIFQSTPKEEKPPVQSGQEKSEAVAAEDPLDTSNPASDFPVIAENDELNFNSDELLLDTEIVAVDKTFYDTRFAAIKSATDSLITDSLTERLAFNSSLRNPSQSKPQTLSVEFWLSPINYRGYMLNGKKVRVYGVLPPFNIRLFSDNENVILQREEELIILSGDKEFHKF